MKKTLLLIITTIFLFSIPTSVNSWEIGAGFSPADHHYLIEYFKPQEGVSYIYITFHNRNVSPKLVENFLRREIKNALEYIPLKNDIFAIPLWHGENDGPRLSDGSPYMIYLHKTKQVLTRKEWGK